MVQTLEDFERKVLKDSTTKAKVCLGLCLVSVTFLLSNLYSLLTKSISHIGDPNNFIFSYHLLCP